MFALIVICIVSLISKTSCQQPTYHRLTTRHGTYNGDTSNSFTCPGNGAIISIKYSFTGTTINSLEFTCSSAAGIASFGPYGLVKGTQGQFVCAAGQYVSSFYGNADVYLENLGVRCRPINETLNTRDVNLGKIGTASKVPPFDDDAYAIGARPVGVIIWTQNGIVSIQLDYANTPLELCTANCTVYKEEFAPLHGFESGSGLKIDVVNCPQGGAITEIKTKVSEGHVQSLQFQCSSGLGTTMTGVYGQPFSTSTVGVTEVKCPPGTIVGSIHGYNGTAINALGIECVVYGHIGESFKYNAQGGTAGTAFDDQKYLNKGLRPIQLQVYYGNSGVYGIRVKYANANVAVNCIVTDVEVTDDRVQATSDGIEVVGVATGVSCWDGAQLLKMEYSKLVSQSVTIAISDGAELNFGASLSVSGTVGVNLFGVKAEVSSGVTQSGGGSKQWSTTHSNLESTSTAKGTGTGITYATPGACAIIGYVDRYKVDQSNVYVRYHYECEIGELPYELGTINLQATTYGNVYYEDYQYKFPSIDGCTKASRVCVKNLNANQVTINSTTFVSSFYNCFN